MNVCNNCGFEFDGDFCPECGTEHRNSLLSESDMSDVTLSASRKCKNCGAEITGNFCPKCGTQHFSSRRICKNCGALVEGRYCSVCGKEYRVKTKLCRKCGSPFVGNYCANCGERDNSSEKLRRKYLAVSRIIPLLFLVFSILLIIDCTTFQLTVSTPDIPQSRIISNPFITDGSDVVLTVFCFFDLAIAIVFTLLVFFRADKKIGKLTLCQITGIVGILCTVIALVCGTIIYCDLNNNLIHYQYSIGTYGYAGYYYPEAGPIFAIVFSAVFVSAMVVFFVLSIVLTKRNSKTCRGCTNELGGF